MVVRMQTATFIRPLCVVLAAAFGFALGACGPASEARMNNVCKDYCNRLVDCNDNTNFDNCVDDCVEQAMGCDTDDDTADALDILNACAEDSCNNVAACSLDAWLECNL